MMRMRHDDFIVKDSGERENFSSGARRDVNTGKPRPDLISPFFLERLGQHLRKGAEKYSPWNWAKGIPNSRCYESLMRHLMQFAQGDRTEDHLSAAAANLMFMIHNEETDGKISMKNDTKSLVDMPVFQGVDK